MTDSVFYILYFGIPAVIFVGAVYWWVDKDYRKQERIDFRKPIIKKVKDNIAHITEIDKQLLQEAENLDILGYLPYLKDSLRYKELLKLCKNEKQAILTRIGEESQRIAQQMESVTNTFTHKKINRKNIKEKMVLACQIVFEPNPYLIEKREGNIILGKYVSELKDLLWQLKDNLLDLLVTIYLNFSRSADEVYLYSSYLHKNPEVLGEDEDSYNLRLKLHRNDQEFREWIYQFLYRPMVERIKELQSGAKNIWIK